MGAGPRDLGPGYGGARKVLANLVIVGMLWLIGSAVLLNHKLTNPALERSKPVITAVGVPQLWSVFAPPRKSTNYLDTRTDYADGTSRSWRLPNHLGFWDYRGYHWKMFGDYVRDRSNAGTWEPLARWIAGRDRAPGREPVAVTLTVTWAKLRPPGPGPSQGRWRADTFYTLRLTPPPGPGSS